MTLDQGFLDNMNKLENFKAHPALKEFFDTIVELKKLGEGISDLPKNASADKSKLDKQAQKLIQKLEVNKDIIAKKTKTQLEYDAVYECIAYMDKYFNQKK